jgi:hypothetical protein
VLLIAIPILLLLLIPFLLAAGVPALLIFFTALRAWRLLPALVYFRPWRLPTILLPGTSLFRRALSILPSRGLLHGPLLIALLILLPHDGVARLVTVALLLQLMLLLHLSGIPIP